LRKAAECHR